MGTGLALIFAGKWRSSMPFAADRIRYHPPQALRLASPALIFAGDGLLVDMCLQK